MKPKIIIVGGGLAGLTNAIILAKADFEVTLVERKTYPFHRVCGEYISNEVWPLLKEIGLNPDDFGASKISKLIISAPNGTQITSDLELGAFGMSRLVLDHELYKIALALGVNFILGEKVLDIRFSEEKFEIELSAKNLIADIVIGAFGKRSNLDQKLKRPFFYQRSPYVGVKYHIKTAFPSDTIQLDNFKGGYCGLSKIESDLYCLCYLAENKYLKQFGSIKLMEEQILRKNKNLNKIFESSEFVWNQPEVINEISFEKKALVENHILMCGDTAGMIAPLCGNGMAIAIHAANILSHKIIEICNQDFNPKKRTALESAYQTQWKKEFETRLMIGRGIQRVFGNPYITSYFISALKPFPKIIKKIVKQTHGTPLYKNFYIAP